MFLLNLGNGRTTRNETTSTSRDDASWDEAWNGPNGTHGTNGAYGANATWNTTANGSTWYGNDARNDDINDVDG